MFCKNCGTPLNNNEIFCGKCGTRIAAAEKTEAWETNTSPIQENETLAEDAFVVKTETINTAVPPIVNQQTFTSQASDLQTPVASPLFTENTNAFKPTKKPGKKGFKSLLKKIGFSAVTIVVVLAVVTVVSWAVNPDYTRNLLAKTFMSSEKYLGYVVKSNAKDLAESLSKTISLSKQYSTSNMSADGSMDVTLGDGFKDLLQDAGVDDTSAFDWIESAGITYSSAVDGNLASADMNLKLNNADLGTLKYYFDIDDQTFYYGFPDYNPKYLAISMNPNGYSSPDYTELAAAIEKIIAILPDEDATKQMLENYAVCIIKAIDDVEKSTEKITADGVSQKVTKLSLDIDGKLILKVSENVLREARKDENIKKVITEAESITGFTYTDYQDAIDEALEEIEDADPDDFGSKVSLNLYVNNNAKIVGCELSASGSKFSIYTTQDGKKFGTLAEMKASGTKLAFEGSCTEDNKKRSGNYVIKYAGSSIVEIKTENIDMNKINEGLFGGSISINLTDEANSLLRHVDGGEIFTKLSLTLQANTESATNIDSNIILNYNNQPCVTMHAKENISGSKTVSIPSDYITVDMYDSSDALAVWVAGCDFSTLADRLRAAKLPEIWLGAVETDLALTSGSVDVTDDTNSIIVTP